MSTPTAEDRERAREIFKDFHILGRRWLDVAEKTEPARDFDAMIRGCTQPTADARTILGILNDIALALSAERARTVAACEKVAESASVIEFARYMGQNEGSTIALKIANAIRALAAPPLDEKETPHE